VSIKIEIEDEAGLSFGAAERADGKATSSYADADDKVEVDAGTTAEAGTPDDKGTASNAGVDHARRGDQQGCGEAASTILATADPYPNNKVGAGAGAGVAVGVRSHSSSSSSLTFAAVAASNRAASNELANPPR
jgi:hypothetical protein